MNRWHSIFVALMLVLSFNQSKAQPASIPPVHSSVIEASHVMCRQACSLAGATITTGASSGFFMLFDATSDPSDGAVVPVYCLAVASGQSTSFSSQNFGRFVNGLVFVFSTGANCVTKAESPTAFFTGVISQ